MIDVRPNKLRLITSTKKCTKDLQKDIESLVDEHEVIVSSFNETVIVKFNQAPTMQIVGDVLVIQSPILYWDKPNALPELVLPKLNENPVGIDENVLTKDQLCIIQTVKKLDKKDGADMDKVIAQCGVVNAAQVIDSMIKVGDLYEIKPGRIKIL